MDYWRVHRVAGVEVAEHARSAHLILLFGHENEADGGENICRSDIHDCHFFPQGSLVPKGAGLSLFFLRLAVAGILIVTEGGDEKRPNTGRICLVILLLTIAEKRKARGERCIGVYAQRYVRERK